MQFVKVSYAFLLPELGVSTHSVDMSAEQSVGEFLAHAKGPRYLSDAEFAEIPLVLTAKGDPDISKCEPLRPEASLAGVIKHLRKKQDTPTLFVRLQDEEKLINLVRRKNVSVEEVPKLEMVLKHVCLLDKPSREDEEDSSIAAPLPSACEGRPKKSVKEKEKETLRRWKLAHKIHVDADQKFARKTARGLTPFVFIRPDFGQPDTTIFKSSTHRLTFGRGESIGQFRCVSARVLLQLPFDRFGKICVRWHVEVPSSSPAFAVSCVTMASDDTQLWEKLDEQVSPEEYLATPEKNFKLKFVFQAFQPGIHSGIVRINFDGGITQYLAFSEEVHPLEVDNKLQALDAGSVVLGEKISGAGDTYKIIVNGVPELENMELMMKKYDAIKDGDVFQNEFAKLLELTDHWNITSIKAIVRAQLYSGIVMPHAKYGTLHQLMLKERLPALVCAKIAFYLASALQALHNCNVVHRNLSTSSVLVHEYDKSRMRVEVTICNLGGAVRMKQLKSVFPGVKDMFGLTHSLTYQLEPDEMLFQSPEMLRHAEELELLKKSDVYSFGMVMYSMIHGKEPFENEAIDGNLADRIVQGLRPVVDEELRAANDEYCSLMELCLAHAPNERPAFDALPQKLYGIVQRGTVDFRQQIGESSPVQWDYASKVRPSIAIGRRGCAVSSPLRLDSSLALNAEHFVPVAAATSSSGPSTSHSASSSLE